MMEQPGLHLLSSELKVLVEKVDNDLYEEFLKSLFAIYLQKPLVENPVTDSEKA